MSPEIISGGGTGTHEIDAELGLFNELQVGSYVFMDNEYGECELFAEAENFETALLVDTRIVSCNTPGMATVDAGSKPCRLTEARRWWWTARLKKRNTSSWAMNMRISQCGP